ncbi:MULTISPECIES: ABC transporter ATP-binding protein [unclassified Variovorax]|uniref:ABC transporter ATP-binding protein n=1 Tax=unclassified Variovorax TaxID=663243 RepID=UPI002575C171|nr:MULTISPECIES: ABC transporter ATP-binding protein [unclassified Variovorax]MDM0089167.1 ABC transporter ATP-binding protein [Variovorax sp. J22G40]MDM0147240.1 ABC transporter ATP-binding protein [Variovorax sp. J2P1-31]
MASDIRGAVTPASGRAPRAVVSVRGALRRFGERTVLRHVDLDIPPGQFVALLGPSGCGKTTLLRLLAELDLPDGGQIDVPARRGVVFQDARLLPWRHVWRNVVLGLPRDRALAEAALAEVGLTARSGDWPGTLSGGEAQRAALARALVRQPELLLLDEPFAALDALTRLRMQQMVLDLWQAHDPAVLLVTHDVDEALLLADRVLVMREGVIAVDLPIDFERPRRRNAPGFEALRERLLAELGVVAPGAASAAQSPLSSPSFLSGVQAP